MSGEAVLSDREREILQLVAEGLTNREIAQRLSISHNTVKVHLSNIFEKAGVASRTEATLYAIQHRIVDVPGGEAEPAKQPYRWVWTVIASAIIIVLIIISSNLLLPNNAQEGSDENERWQELAPLPEARINMAVVAYSGDIYVVGGEGPEGVSGMGFRYMPETGEWFLIAEKPTPVTNVNAVVIGEKIYVPGGQLANGQPTDILEIYDPRQDSWDTGEVLPEATSSYALADFEGQMYLFGGWDGQKALNSVWIYNPTNPFWQAGSEMEIARWGADALVQQSGIAILGGANEISQIETALIYFPIRDAQNELAWEEAPSLDKACENFDSIVISDTIFIVGGDNPADEVGNCKSAQYKTGNWYEWNIRAFAHPETVLNNSYLYILDTNNELTKTQFVQTNEIYYEVYLPIIN